MSDHHQLPLSVQPVISYPREAEVGKTYLMTIDLQTSGDEWPYEEEEYPIYCMLETSPLFSSKPVGEPAIVLHRFGGSYGAAQFLLTAAEQEIEGEIRVTLVNGWGVPIRVLNLSDVMVTQQVNTRAKSVLNDKNIQHHKQLYEIENADKYEVDWSQYLESICTDEKYLGWQDFYTPTDALYRQRSEKEQLPRRLTLSLMEQTAVPSLETEAPREEKAEKEQVERLEVLTGLRKYADNHVLLVGKPGSGKSTALERLLWEEAEKTRTQPQEKIPVLVELRRYKTSVLGIIDDFLFQHRCRLNEAEIEQLLLAGRFLLLVDGWDELPDDKARGDVKNFREKYQHVTPMIFTTRELAGDIGIEKKLKMQPLTEAQMQQFVLAYLPEQGERLLQQLQGRLRELGETPLLLWMLCELFKFTSNIPLNLGLALRHFAQSYDSQIKQDVSTDESRSRWFLLLQHLAFEMMSGKTATDLRVTIPKQEAEEILTRFLTANQFDKPRECAFNWLNDLLKYHLIQLTNSNREIEFHHQSLQEYYAAERLLVLLPQLGDDTLKQDYLNYLKWTEPLALMLGLLEDEKQALRVVKLAFEVDLQLGARLAAEALGRTIRTVPVIQVDITKNQVQLQIGEANGIKKGAEFNIFKFRTRDFDNSDNRVATVKVVELGASDCWAEVKQLFGYRTINNQLAEEMIEIGSPAVYLSPGLKQIRKVRVILPNPLPQLPDVNVNVTLLPAILESEKEKVEGHLWIKLCSETEKDEDMDYFVSLNSAGEYLILDDQKQPIKNFLAPIKLDEPEATKKLINRLIHVGRYETILDLDNEEASAPLNGKLKVELVKSVKRQEVVLNAEGKVAELEEGERVTLRISNQSNRTLNISALILQADLSIVKFYPKGVAYEVVDAGQSRETRFDIELPENYQEGVDIIKVFATVDGTNFQFLELPALDQSRKGFGNQKPKNALEQLLAAVVDEDNPQRNIRVVAYASEEWTTEKVEMVIKKSVV